MTERTLAKGLGWFSLGLGLAELLAPRWLGRQTGLGQRPALLRALGLREVAAGVGVLGQRRPVLPLWARVAGGGMDLGVLVGALRGRSNRARLLASMGAVLGVGALDLLAARRLEAA